MPLSMRLGLAILVLLATCVSPVGAQTRPLAEDARSEILKKPTPRELDHLEAVKLYGLALRLEQQNRLPEALKTFEQAIQLDPDAVPPRRALIPLYLALDRPDDSLKACEAVLKLDPADHDTWYLYARQLRSLDRLKEARAAMEKAAQCPGLKERPDIKVLIVYDLGVLYEQAKELDQAEKAFREAAELLDHPLVLQEQGPYSGEEITQQAAETYERLGRICLQAGHTDRAVAAFQKAQAKDPARSSRLALNLAEVYAAQKKPTEALKHLDIYLARQPPGIEGYELKIKLLTELNRSKEIVATLENYSRNDPHHVSLQLLLAREYRKAGATAPALRLYNKLIQTDPGVEVFRDLFAFYREQPNGVGEILNRLDRAITEAAAEDDEKRVPGPTGTSAAVHARAMLAIVRDDRGLVKALLPVARRRVQGGQDLGAQTRLLLATLAVRGGQIEDAELLYRTCLDDKGRVLKIPGVRNVEQEVYGGLLRVLSLAHKPRAIVELCHRGLEHAEATNRVMFYLDLARAEMALDHGKEALKAIDAAVDHASEHDRLLCRCARVDMLARLDRVDDAVAECQAMLKEYRKPGEIRGIRYTLSGVYSTAKQHARAEEQLRAILKDDPNDATANNDLGYLWADQNRNLEEAEKLIRKALDLDQRQRQSGTGVTLDSDQDNAAYIDSLGWVLFRRGKLAEARKQMERAVKLPGGTDDPVVWDHLGDVCFQQKDSQRAVEAWKKALECYEAGQRQKSDGRYKDIQHKLKVLVTTGSQQR